MAKVSAFQRFELFAQVPPDALSKLEAVASRRTYEDGQVIMVEGDPSTPVLFVLEGTIRAFHTNPDGREQTLHLLGPGSAVNLPVAFASEASAPASAMALGQVRLLAVGQYDLRRVVSETPSLALVMMRDLSEKLRHFTNLTYDLSLRSVRGRLASFLLEQADAEMDSPVRWTHEAIAARIGTVREVVSRTMRAFVKEGLIKLERQRVTVLDRQALEAEADS